METTPYKSEIKELEQMRYGVSWRVPIELRKFTLWLRPLTALETERIDDAVITELGKLPAQYRTTIKQARLTATETIKRASTEDITSEVMGLYDPQINEMTHDEISYFYQEYCNVMARVNPALEKMPAEQLALLVDALKKTPAEELGSLLTELSSRHLRSLVHFLLTNGD